MLNPENLYCNRIDATAREHEWEGSGWSFAVAYECADCGRTVVVTDDRVEAHDTREDLDDEADAVRCVGSGRRTRDQGPAMQFWWPVSTDLDLQDAAFQLRGIGSVCAVDVEGTVGIALTGGGCDLSWEICASYIALGFLPPFALVDHLPTMAGAGLSARKLDVLAAADRTIEVWQAWGANGARHLAHVRDVLSQNSIGPSSLDGVPADEIELAKRIAELECGLKLGWSRGASWALVDVVAEAAARDGLTAEALAAWMRDYKRGITSPYVDDVTRELRRAGKRSK